MPKFLTQRSIVVVQDRRHSCKMYIKGKHVRFGFRLWCICSSSGYLYTFFPYAGAAGKKNDLGLCATVVLELLSIVKNSQNHNVFFLITSFRRISYSVFWKLKVSSPLERFGKTEQVTALWYQVKYSQNKKGAPMIRNLMNPPKLHW